MTAKSHSSAAQSKRSRAGNDAEAYVELLHVRCRAAGVAWMYRIPTPTKVVGKLPTEAKKARVLPMVYTDKSTADYMGHGSKRFGGRSILVEAKFTEGGVVEGSRIEPHQAEALEIASREGALAVLAIVSPEKTLAIPWSWIRQNVTSTSLYVENLARWVIDDTEPYLLPLLEAF